jgi:hypothetical protein
MFDSLLCAEVVYDRGNTEKYEVPGYKLVKNGNPAAL